MDEDEYAALKDRAISMATELHRILEQLRDRKTALDIVNDGFCRECGGDLPCHCWNDE